MSRHRKRNGIPDRWLDYKAVGKRLEGTRFIAFKVPLKQSLNSQLPPSDVFGHWELLDALNRANQELGLIIDLTYTTRYYKIKDIPESLMFVKIFTEGHEVPSDNTILSFKRAVRGFLRDNAENDKLIGVHCTHGLNRTGYLICRYLIDVDGMDPKKAVELFNLSRGHAIERKNYLDDLQHGPKRSNEGMENSEQEPKMGCAAHRPSETQSERRPPHSDSRNFRSSSQRGTNPGSHHHYPNNGLLPRPPLHPSSAVFTHMGAPPFHRPYRWDGPPPDSHRGRPRHSDNSRFRYPTAEPHWTRSSWQQEDRRRGPPPPPLPPPPPTPPALLRYTPRWSDQSNGHDAAVHMCGAPQMRHGQRYSDRNRHNSWDNFSQ